MDSRLLALTRVITLGPLFFDLLAIDRYVFRSGNPFLGFPRNLTELFAPPDRVFRLLQREGVIPASARCISCEHCGGADTEPDKNVARIDIVYSTPGSQREELRVLKPELGTKPRIYYKNLHLTDSLFIGGTVIDGKTDDCIDGAEIKLIKGGQEIAQTHSDCFGEFKFDGLPLQEADYQLEITHGGRSAKHECRVSSSAFLGLISL